MGGATKIPKGPRVDDLAKQFEERNLEMQQEHQMGSRSEKPNEGNDSGHGPIQSYFDYVDDYHEGDSDTSVFGEVGEPVEEFGEIGEPSHTGQFAGLGSEDSPVVGLRCFCVGEEPYSVVATPQFTVMQNGHFLTMQVLTAARRLREVELGGSAEAPDSLDAVPVVLGSFGGGRDLISGVLVEVSYSDEVVSWRRRGRVDVAGPNGGGLVEVVRLFEDEIPIELDPEHVPVIDRALSNAESQKSLVGTDVHAINLTMDTIGQDVIEVWQIDAVIALVIPTKDAAEIWHVYDPAERLRRVLDVLDNQEASTRVPPPKLAPNYDRQLPDRYEILRRFDTLPDIRRDEAISKVTSMYERNKDNDKEQLKWLARLPVPQRPEPPYSKGELAALVSNLREKLDLAYPGTPKVARYLVEHLAFSQACITPLGSHPLLVGPPGVGKTKVAKEYARALGREFRKIDLGGLNDPHQLRGFHVTYLRAEPGQIISAVASCETANPVVLLDEIDKTGDTRGPVLDVFLSLLDPDNAGMFIDTYLDVPYDLSGVTWIATANSLAPIPAALLDRLSVVEIPGYADDQKHLIVSEALLPEIIANLHVSLRPSTTISDAVIDRLIELNSGEMGLRTIRQWLETLFMKLIVAELDGRELELNPSNVAGFLGLSSFEYAPSKHKGPLGYL